MAAPTPPPQISGVRKAAILLLTLGSDASAEIMRHFSAREIEELTAEISKIREVSNASVGAVLAEFAQLAQAHSYILQGGLTYARDVLHKAMGQGKGDEILNRLQVNLHSQPFSSIRKAGPKQLSDFLRREHPQTVALVLANLDAEPAANILQNLSLEVRVDVIQRLATMETTSPEVIKQVDQVLERRLASVFTQEVATIGGAKAVAEILNCVDRAAEKQIFEALEPVNPQLAEDIRALMFTFDDLHRLDDRGIQRLLKDVEQRDLALSLRAAAENVVSRIYSNLSERAQTMLKQEIEFLGPVRLKDVEESQSKIVRTVRQLEESGEIVIASRDTGDVLV